MKIYGSIKLSRWSLLKAMFSRLPTAELWIEVPDGMDYWYMVGRGWPMRRVGNETGKDLGPIQMQVKAGSAASKMHPPPPVRPRV